TSQNLLYFPSSDTYNLPALTHQSRDQPINVSAALLVGNRSEWLDEDECMERPEALMSHVPSEPLCIAADDDALRRLLDFLLDEETGPMIVLLGVKPFRAERR